MEIFIKQDFKHIYKLINSKSKYQKVLLLYDNSVSTLQIKELHSEIKEICIFNSMDINNVDEQEFYNGYRLLIFMCTSSSVLNFNLNREDFINIYYPTDTFYSTFFSNNFKLLTKDCFLIVNNPTLDLTLLSSFYFNSLYSYIYNILNGTYTYKLNLQNFEITLFNLIETLNNVQFKFKDFEIAKLEQIGLIDLPIMHLIIIDAFIVFITAVKNNDLSLIDTFKIAEDINVVESIYAKYFNTNTYNTIIINFNCLYQSAVKAKENIIQTIKINNNVNLDNFNNIISKTKHYLKNCNCFLNYLYIFNIFGI